MKLLRRTTSGLLYIARNPQIANNAGDWTEGGSIDLGTSGGNLTFFPNTGNHHCLAVITGIASRSQVLIHARINRPANATRLGVAVHVNDLDHATADAVALSASFGASGTALIQEIIAGSPGTLDSLASQNYSGTVSMNLAADGTSILGWDSHTNRNWAGTSSVSAGQVGIYCTDSATGSAERGEALTVFAQASHLITVGGLTSGDVVEVRSSAGVVLASANESSGSASVSNLIGDSANRLVVVRVGEVYARALLPWKVPLAGGDVYTLDEDTDVLGDARQIQWLSPAAIHRSGRTYVGGIGQLGDVRVASLDDTTGEMASSGANGHALTDWTEGDRIDLSVSAGELLFFPNTNGSHCAAVLNQVGSRSTVFIHARMRRDANTTRLGVFVHGSDFSHASADYIALTGAFGFSSAAQLSEWVAGTQTVRDTLASQTYTGTVAMNLFADGSSILGWDSHTARDWAATAGTHTSGQVGVYCTDANSGINERGNMPTLLVSTHHTITVTGLTTGDTVELRDADGNVVSSGSESGGSATVSAREMPSPGIQLFVVRSAADHANTEQPFTDPVCGGDTWGLSGSTLTRSVSGLLYVRHGQEIGDLGENDEHNAPALVPLGDERIGVFFARHNVDTTVRFRKTVTPRDVTAWTDVDTVTFGGNVTYPNIYRVSTGSNEGRLVLFVRRALDRWDVAYSDDEGDNWTLVGTFIGVSNRLYLATTQAAADPDLLTVLITWHPTLSTIHELYVIQIDLATGDITEPGNPTPLGDLYDSGTLPIDPTDGLLVYDATGTDVTLGIAANEFGEVLFRLWQSATPEDARYKYVKFDPGTGSVGTIRDIVAAGGSYHPTEVINGDGDLGVDEGVVYLAREDSGEWLIEAWATADEGASFESGRLDADEDEVPETFRVTPRTVRGDADGSLIFSRLREYFDAVSGWSSDLLLISGEAPSVEPEPENNPPTDPGTPTPDIAGPYDTETVTWTWAESTDPDSGDVVTYEARLCPVGDPCITLDTSLTDAEIVLAMGDHPSGFYALQVRATDGSAFNPGGWISSAQFEIDHPDAPVLRGAGVTATTASVRIDTVDAAWISVLYEYSLTSDFASIEDSEERSGASIDDWTITGLTTGVPIFVRAAARLADSSLTPYSNTVRLVPFATFEDNFETGGNIFTSPHFHFSGGPTIEFCWAGDVDATSFEILLNPLDDEPEEWLVLATESDLVSLDCFTPDLTDESLFPDGWYVVAVVIDSIRYEHPGFYLDRAATAIDFEEMPDTLDDWEIFGDPSKQWASIGGTESVCPPQTPHPTHRKWRQFGHNPVGSRLAYTGIAAQDGWQVASNVSIWTAGTPFVAGSGIMYEAEFANASVGMVNDEMAVFAFIGDALLHPECGPFLGTSNNGEFGVTFSITNGVTTFSTSFRETGLAFAASFRTGIAVCDCNFPTGGRKWLYPIVLRYSRPDPTNFPQRVRVQARLGAPYGLLIDETFDVPDAYPLDDLACMYPAFGSSHTANFTFSDAGWRQYDSFHAQSFGGTCEPGVLLPCPTTSVVTWGGWRQGESLPVVIGPPEPEPEQPVISGEWPNLDLLSETPFVAINQPFQDKDLGTEPDGDIWAYSGEWSSANVVIVEDEDAPASADYVRFIFSEGFEGGASPGRAVHVGGDTGGYSECYIGYWIRLNEDWQPHPSGVDKIIGYWGVRQGFVDTGLINQFMLIRNTDGRIQTILQYAQGGGQRRSPSGGETYENDIAMSAGVWHLIEIICNQSTGGASNGRMRVFLDGVILFDLTDVCYDESGDAEMTGVDLDCVWGGVESEKDAEDTIDISHILYAGVPS